MFLIVPYYKSCRLLYLHMYLCSWLGTGLSPVGRMRADCLVLRNTRPFAAPRCAVPHRARTGRSCNVPQQADQETQHAHTETISYSTTWCIALSPHPQSCFSCKVLHSHVAAWARPHVFEMFEMFGLCLFTASHRLWLETNLHLGTRGIRYDPWTRSNCITSTGSYLFFYCRYISVRIYSNWLNIERRGPSKKGYVTQYQK